MSQTTNLADELVKTIAEETLPSRQIRDVFLKALNRGVNDFKDIIKKQTARGIISPKISKILLNTAERYNKEEIKKLLLRASELADYEYIRPLIKEEFINDLNTKFNIDFERVRLSVERGRGFITIKIYLDEKTFKNIQPKIREISKYIRIKLRDSLKERFYKVPEINIRFVRG